MFAGTDTAARCSWLRQAERFVLREAARERVNLFNQIHPALPHPQISKAVNGHVRNLLQIVTDL